MLSVFAIKKGRSEYHSVIFNFQVYINKSTLSMISSLNEYSSLLSQVGASQSKTMFSAVYHTGSAEPKINLFFLLPDGCINLTSTSVALGSTLYY